jgi:hypothetical protein
LRHCPAHTQSSPPAFLREKNPLTYTRDERELVEHLDVTATNQHTGDLIMDVMHRRLLCTQERWLLARCTKSAKLYVENEAKQSGAAAAPADGKPGLGAHAGLCSVPFSALARCTREM